MSGERLDTSGMRVDIFGGVEDGHPPQTDERVCSAASPVLPCDRAIPGVVCVYHLDAIVVPGGKQGTVPFVRVEPVSSGGKWICPSCGYSTLETAGVTQ